MEQIKAAIFDLDGTIIDSMYVWEKIDRDFLMQRGIPVTKEYTDTVRGMYFETAAQYTKETYGLTESIEQIMSVWLSMAEYEYAHHVRLKPFVREYLIRLRNNGIRTALATSSNPRLLEPVLKNNRIDHLFDAVCYTSEAGRNKSFPDVYLYTADQLGVAPQHCMVFEDIPEGIHGAALAGMYTVAVYDRASEGDSVYLKQHADRYIITFSEMLEEII